MLEFQKERIANGQCYVCGDLRKENGTSTMCRRCADDSAIRTKKWRLKRGKDSRPRHGGPGVCRDCWVPLPADETRKRCTTCRKKGSLVSKQYRESRRLKGVCMSCGNPNIISIGKEISCEDCYFKRIALKRLGSAKRWKELRDLWYEQNGICPYTGIKLQLCVNAHLDHKLPVCRFPESAHDISNVEFVLSKVNEMKNSYTKDEFINLVRLIQIKDQPCLPGPSPPSPPTIIVAYSVASSSTPSTGSNP